MEPQPQFKDDNKDPNIELQLGDIIEIYAPEKYFIAPKYIFY